MVKINNNYNILQAGYLFAEIARKTQAFQDKYPGVSIMRLGIGNTTEPLPPSVIDGLMNGVKKLAIEDTYTGYGDEQGNQKLRSALAAWYHRLGVTFGPKEIFISDGAKPDTANIASIFADTSIIAVQDPVYPVYVDTNVISGRGGSYRNGRYKNIVYMDCVEENGFFPHTPKKHVDLIYICSPNNPTGAVATREQLQKFVEYAISQKAVIIFDGAYSAYITDEKIPRSIYEIAGAEKCAIEISSFSKWAGFTGVRLGWTVVPMQLTAEKTRPGDINNLWNRRQVTMFNGASSIAQEGGLAVLSKKGQNECKKIISYYMKNAQIIREGMIRLGLDVFGGVNAPYIWMKTPKGMTSWDFFDKLLTETNVVGTPGSGFGRMGEGYFRLSAFGHQEVIRKAVKSIQENLQL